MIWPDTAHPAFTKGAHLFGVEVVVAPTDPVTTQVDVDFVRRAIDHDTAVVIAPAGNYPYGTIDPIEELSSGVLEKGAWLHVDGCLGGWILPWGQRLGYPNIPLFDLRLPGVTPISADTHKYGYGLKGTSVLAWRDKSFRRYQYYVQSGWKGGAYASPGIAGSRSGGLIAATWASMMGLGRQGYLDRARKIFDTAFRMQDAVVSNGELKREAGRRAVAVRGQGLRQDGPDAGLTGGPAFFGAFPNGTGWKRTTETDNGPTEADNGR